jgi:hypothetical protein
MARMDFAAAPQAPIAPVAPAHWRLVEPAPMAPQHDDRGHWSIDDEQAGETWHDSSWVLLRGLQVSEAAAPEVWPQEWSGCRWNDCLRDAALAGFQLVHAG